MTFFECISNVLLWSIALLGLLVLVGCIIRSDRREQKCLEKKFWDDVYHNMAK